MIDIYRKIFNPIQNEEGEAEDDEEEDNGWILTYYIWNRYFTFLTPGTEIG